MLFQLLKILYYKIFCGEYEMRIIERTNSTETFITYESDDDR